MITSDDISDFAVRKHHIGGGQVGKFELRHQSVGSPQINNNSIRYRDLRPFVQNKLTEGPGPDSVGSEQIQDGSVAGQDLGTALLEQIEGSNSLVANGVSSTPEGNNFGTTVEQVGGPIGAGNDTKLVEIPLRAGTYMVSVDGAFMYPPGTTPHADGVSLWPQLSLWVDENDNDALDWDPATGGEGSISPNALMPNMNDRHMTVSGSTVLTITEDQVSGGDDPKTVPVHVSAFGYDSEQGQAGEGQLEAVAELNVVEVTAPEAD